MEFMAFLFGWYIDEICYFVGRIGILGVTFGRVRILARGQQDPRINLRTRYEMFKRREDRDWIVSHKYVSAFGALLLFGPAALLVWLIL